MFFVDQVCRKNASKSWCWSVFARVCRKAFSKTWFCSFFAQVCHKNTSRVVSNVSVWLQMFSLVAESLKWSKPFHNDLPGPQGAQNIFNHTLGLYIIYNYIWTLPVRISDGTPPTTWPSEQNNDWKQLSCAACLCSGCFFACCFLVVFAWWRCTNDKLTKWPQSGGPLSGKEGGGWPPTIYIYIYIYI